MFSTTSFMVGLGIFTAIAATVVLFIFVLPDKKRENLPKFLKTAHDLFTFKSLLIEKMLQALYVFSTAACIFVGFFLLFGFNVYNGYYYNNTTWFGGYGILIMLIGPIVVRLVFEVMMLFVLLVKNTIQINNKLKSQVEEPEKAEEVSE